MDLLTRYLGLELRGLLSVPAGTDAVAYERAGYVAAIRAAANSYGH